MDKTAQKYSRLSKDDLKLALAFYKAACNVEEYTEHIKTVEDLSEEELDELVKTAQVVGFKLNATRAERAMEKMIAEAGVNAGQFRIFTGYYGNFNNIEKYGATPIRIARFAPRFNKAHAACLSLAPSAELLKGAKDGTITDADWKSQFAAQLAALDQHEVVKELERLGNGRDVVILCYEKPDEKCHRHYVADWLKKAGYPVTEFPNNHSPERQLAFAEDIKDE